MNPEPGVVPGFFKLGWRMIRAAGWSQPIEGGLWRRAIEEPSLVYAL